MAAPPNLSVIAFKALGDPTRQRILALLNEREMTIGEVAEHFDMTRAGVKKHMKLLEEGRLITVEARGRERINSLNPEGFKTVTDWLGFFERFWDNRLNALQIAIEKDQQ